MAKYSYELRIPQERVAVLIGKKGTIKKQLEEETKTKIEVDSKEGDVFVSGEDAINLFTIRDIVIAIGRGFNPEVATLLLKSDYMFEIVNIPDFVKSKNQMMRQKGRIIGREGKARQCIEELTDTHISVFGKTAAIIGLPENVALARKAIKNLLIGSPHSTVYKWLEKKRAEAKREQYR